MEKCEGIVYGSIDYKEKSKIVYLYTKSGHMSVRANNSKSAKSNTLTFTTSGNVVDFVKTDASFPALKEHSLVKSYFSYTENLDKLDALNKILNLVKQIPEDIDHERTYQFVLKMIDSIKNNDPYKVLSIFYIKMLSVFGIAPRLKACTRCGGLNPAMFVVADGGMVCSNCTSIRSEDLDNYNIWLEYYYTKKEINLYTETNYKKLINQITLYYNTYSGIRL